MEAIISNAGATAGDVKTSSQNTEIAAGLLQSQGSKRGKNGKAIAGPGDPTSLSTFAGMLKLASRKSAPGTANNFLPVGEPAASGGKSSLKTGGRKMAGLTDEKVPADTGDGINLYPLLAGLGLQTEQVEKIIQETEGTPSRQAGETAKEKGKAGEKIAALLAGYGVTGEKIQGVLSALANGRSGLALSPAGQQEAEKETGNVLETTGRKVDASGEIALGRPEGKFPVPPDGLKTKEDERTIKAAPGRKGQDLTPQPAPAAAKEMASEGEGAGSGYVSSEMGDQENETPASGTADARDMARKGMGIVPLREGPADKGKQQVIAVPPFTEAAEGTDGALGVKSLPAEKDAPAEGGGAGNARIRAKQRPAAFKEQFAGVQQSRERQDRLPDETAAAGKNGSDASLMDLAGKKAGKEDEGGGTMPLRGSGGAAGESTAARVEQGSLFSVSGAVNDGKAETVPGLRPEVVIEQIAAQAGQLPQNAPGRIKITLNPPHLGTLDMDVLIRNNKVEVVMIASSQEVQQVLKAHGDQLKNALQGQGFKMDGFDVMLQGNQSGPEYRFRDGSFTRDGRPEGGGRKESGEMAVSRPGIVTSHTGTGAVNRDGISLFV